MTKTIHLKQEIEAFAFKQSLGAVACSARFNRTGERQLAAEAYAPCR